MLPQSLKVGDLSQYALSPWKVFITLYALNVVAWGGMLFLLLCNAAPAMCHPDCGSLNSSRRVWIDVDSRILTTMLAAPAFIFSFERLQNLLYILRYRVQGDHASLLELAAAYNAWFCIGVPVCCKSVERAGFVSGSSVQYSTALWKLDCVSWALFTNTIAYAVLMIFMWCFNRFDRPIWSGPCLVGIAFICMITARLIQIFEKRHWKGHRMGRYDSALLTI